MSVSLLPFAFVALAAGPNFSDTWYHEVIEGDLRKAYDQYRQIFERPTSASSSVDDVGVRRMAAYRAGLCAEKRGQIRDARNAYEWFHDFGSPGDIWTQRALARLEVLKRRPPFRAGRLLDNETAVHSSVSPLPVAQREIYTENMEQSLAARREAARQLGESVARYRDEEKQRRRVQIVLRGVGVELYWPRSPETPVAATLASGSGVETAPLPPRDRFGAILKLVRGLSLDAEAKLLLERRVARRVHVEGLKALRAHDLYRARAAFQLYRDYRDAGRPELDREDVVYSENLRLLQSVQKILDTTTGLAKIAAQRLAAADRNQYADIIGRARAGLSVAKRQLESEDREEALRLLQIVLTVGASAPPGLRSDGKLGELVLQAREYSRFLLLDADRGRLEMEVGKQTRDVFQFVDELIISALSEPRYLLSDIVGAAPLLEDPERMRPRLRREVERRLELVEALLTAGTPEDRERGSSSEELSAGDLLALLEWFPEIDEDDRMGRRIRRLPGQK